MSSKKKRTEPRQEDRSASDYYRLKTDAIDDLVNANEENSPEVSEEELKKYRQSKSKFHISDGLKAAFIKFWFYGAVCYFCLWGLGNVLSSTLDLMAVTAVAMGLVTNLLTNNVLRFISKTEGAFDRFMMFPSRLTIMLLCDVLYACVIMFCTYLTYDRINALIMYMTGNTQSIVLGVGPILFGVFCTAFDMLFILAKNTFKSIVHDAKESAKKERSK